MFYIYFKTLVFVLLYTYIFLCRLNCNMLWSATNDYVQDESGAINISDDIAVFGVDQRPRDKALYDAPHQLQQDAGLTANLEKCE